MVSAFVPVPYVRAALFKTVPDARDVYRVIYAACVGPDRDYDLGVVTALWDGNLPVLVVNAIALPPPEVQATIEQLLEPYARWTPPQAFVEALLLRRLRQMAAEEGTLQPSGYRVVDRSGMYTQVDMQGRDYKGG